jgi:serine/threonine protein kinase
MWSRVFLNRYRSVRLLGEGGMGRAYLARELNGDRLVVVKVLHEEFAKDSQGRLSFQREMELLARFRHPGAVEFYEASMTDPNGPCLVMEYVNGEPLDKLLPRHGRLPPERVGRQLGNLSSVLQAAHKQGIIHRDLKPANIMVVDADKAEEHVKVLDFGLARLNVASADGLYIPVDKFTGARANAVVGTPEYTCPEVLRGEQPDPRSDLYSVGVILYELLTGRLPFGSRTSRAIGDILSAQAHQPPPPFSQWKIEPPLSPALEAVVQSCLAKDPAERPQTARELAERYGAASGQKLWDEPETEQLPPAAPVSPLAGAEEADAPDGVVYQLEAWMPQQIAAVKLRGFLDEAGGEVIDSVPGRIRVRFWRRKKTAAPVSNRGRWPWSGLLGRSEPAPELEETQMDVSMARPAPYDPGRLLLTVQLRPAEILPLQAAAEWRDWCDLLHRNLKAYLMARK